MSRVIILTDRNNSSKYYNQKKALFESRLQMNSSRKKNNFPLSISNNSSNVSRKSSYIKNYIKNSKEKINIYYYNNKNTSNLNSNKNIFNDNNSNNNMTSKNNITIKNYNSTFNNFARELKKYIYNNNNDNINIQNNKKFYSNKTFLNKSLNNSVIGKSIIHSKNIGNFEKINKLKNEESKKKKKVLSLSNSLNKDKNINNKQYNENIKIKKKLIENNVKKKFLILKDKIDKSNNNDNDLKYSNTIITSNYPKLPLRVDSNKNNIIIKNIKEKNNENENKETHDSYTSCNIIKLGKADDDNIKNLKETNNNINLNNGNKIKLKKTNIDIKRSKDKLYKNNKFNIKINNNDINIYRNNYRLSCKGMNRTSINSKNKKNKKQKGKKETKNKDNKNININININNIGPLNKNINQNNYKDNKSNNDLNVLELIKVKKLESTHCLSENSKINIKIEYSYNEQSEEEEEEVEDSNILSMDDVRDIIKNYNFTNINKNDKYLFKFNDYEKFIEQRKSFLINEFFEKFLQTQNLTEEKKSQKNSNKKNFVYKKINKYNKNNGLYSPNHIINSEISKKYKNNKK